MATLSNFYNPISFTSASNYLAQFTFSPVTADLNGDGNQDLIVLGANYPNQNPPIINVAQSGLVLFGNSNGGFTPASQSIFPWETLQTVHPRKVITEDINGDGIKDVFVSCHGWDTDPFPGEQNHLFLSKKDGTWYDATSKLPKLNDFSHTSAISDINNDGKLDIFVGNGYGGQNNIFSYILENKGNDTFKLNRANIPAKNSLLDFSTVHHFPGASLVDLNKDNLPELIIMPDASASFDKNKFTTILWNNKGKFSESSKTILSAPSGIDTQIALDTQATDINGDGLKDLIVIGTQGQPFYDGWFVQIFLNEGNKKYVDMTSTFLKPQDAWGGVHGGGANEPWPSWINVFDFNHDGFNDFWLEFGNAKSYTPIVWLNDGTGHFTTLKVSDFVDSSNQYFMGISNHFYQTSNGWSIVSTQNNNGQLLIGGLLATTPYNETIKTTYGKMLFGESGNDSLVGSNNDDSFYAGVGNDTLQGGLGSDTFVMDSALNGKTNVDTIVDFMSGSDKIQLSKAIFKAFTKDSSVSSDKLFNGTIAMDSNDFLIYDQTTGKLYYDADGSGPKSQAIQIAIIGTDTHTTLTAADFTIT